MRFDFLKAPDNAAPRGCCSSAVKENEMQNAALRPDEVARGYWKKAGFTVDVVTNKTYGYRRGENYVYVNREARMGRTALIIHPRLKDRSSSLADLAFGY